MALYMPFKKDGFATSNNFPKTQVYPFVMSESDSIDIDSLEDLLMFEKKLEEK
jgi:CMP-N-acetylneuraminic acid synthetase